MNSFSEEQVLFWLKLYHSCAYECYNLYNSSGNLVGFVPRELGQKVERHLGMVEPSELNDEISGKDVLLGPYKYHKLIDPKRPETLEGNWAEEFSKILSLSVYNSLGLMTRVFRGPHKIWQHVSELVDTKSQRLLNVGCGYESELIPCLNHFDLLVNLDLISFGKKDKGRLYVIADAFSLPFRGSSFDIVFCLFVLEHISNISKTIRQIWHVLREGGIAIFGMPLMRTNATKTDLRAYLNPPFFHLRLFSCKKIQGFEWIMSFDELETLIIDTGFKKDSSMQIDINGGPFNSKDSNGAAYEQLFSICKFVKRNSIS